MEWKSYFPSSARWRHLMESLLDNGDFLSLEAQLIKCPLFRDKLHFQSDRWNQQHLGDCVDSLMFSIFAILSILCSFRALGQRFAQADLWPSPSLCFSENFLALQRSGVNSKEFREKLTYRGVFIASASLEKYLLCSRELCNASEKCFLVYPAAQ